MSTKFKKNKKITVEVEVNPVKLDPYWKPQQKLQKEAKLAVAVAAEDEPVKPQPVEGPLPGLPHTPKQKKVVEPVKFAGDINPFLRLTVLEDHFVRLLERMSIQNGGEHTEALEALRADLDKAKK